MHECIMVKIGGSKNRILSKKRKFHENRGAFTHFAKKGIYKFCGNRGKCNMHHWLKGLGRPWFSFARIKSQSYVLYCTVLYPVLVMSYYITLRYIIACVILKLVSCLTVSLKVEDSCTLKAA